MEGQFCQEVLQALNVHLEVGLDIRGCLIQCMELHHCQTPAEVIKELYHSHLCLVELPGSILLAEWKSAW